MFPVSPLLRRQSTLVLATSWCALLNLQAFAAEPEPAPASPPAASPASRPETPPSPLAAPDLVEPPSLIDPNPPRSPAAPPARSQNVTINLINRLVQRGVLAKEDAADLIKQAEDDAATARAEAVANQLPPMTDDTVRVTYIPESVKKQMRDQIKQEVMTQARNENWAAPRSLPEWVTRVRFSGDIRVRYESLLYPEGNDNTGALPNFNTINTGAPFDVAGNQFSPQINTDQDRQRMRLRLRLGAEVEMGEGFSVGVRLATGENNSPITTNQSLGLANQGQGGNFSKYAIWLDRAFLKNEIGGQTDRNLSVSLGRFDNPFFNTSEIMWDEDLGFDGVVVQGKYQVAKGLTPFFVGGVFPIFNTDLNFSTNRPDKFSSTDKWLYGGQLGVNWKITKDLSAKFGAAYCYFDGAEGRLSDPFTPLTSQDAGNTDDTRPSFAQKGNTYMPLRVIVPDVSNNFGTTNQFQYFGLATPFRNLALSARIDYNHYEPFQVSLGADYVKNLAFDRNDINQFAVNNRGPNTAAGTLGSFEGGDTAWCVNLKVGSAALEKRWDWNVNVGYRHVESDAVIDGFNDSEFGGGGTNLEGYTIGGNLALSRRVWLGLRWLSANEIAGPTYKNDVIQVDISGKF
jgi:hypothetical protein